VADGPEVADLRKRLKQVEFQLNFERNLSRNLSSTVDSNQVEIDKLKEALQDKDYRLDRALGDVYLLRKQVQELLSWKSDRNARIGIALGLIRDDPSSSGNTLSKVYNLFRDL
jgi:chromosome segregation ATPase